MGTNCPTSDPAGLTNTLPPPMSGGHSASERATGFRLSGGRDSRKELQSARSCCLIFGSGSR